MKIFWKVFFANLFTLFFLIALFVVGCLSAVFYVGKFVGEAILKKEPTALNGSTLVINMGINFTEAPPDRSIIDAIDNLTREPCEPSIQFIHLINAIRQAADDDSISEILLKGSLLKRHYTSGFAMLEEWRDTLKIFQSKGKKVYAYLADPSIKDYYLASVADEIIMNPFAWLPLNGLAVEPVYLKNVFDKYGIGVQTTRVGKYKSFVETFTESAMSEADREQTQLLLSTVWNKITSDIAYSRGLENTDFIDEIGIFTPDQALFYHLVDEIGYWDKWISRDDSKADSSRFISLIQYVDAMDCHSSYPCNKNDKLALVYAEGTIVYGIGEYDEIGGDWLAKVLRDLRQDDKVKAVVLRMNTPGGSALASEIAQREVVLLAEQKPIVISMSNVCASGGYWISAPATYIFAENTTITGSIGVFDLLFNIKEITRNVGITWDVVKTSSFADIFSIVNPKNPKELALLQSFTDFIYNHFIEKVASGRNLDIEAVREIAQGRVWAGQQALELGLVDQIGGLANAIDYAIEKGHLKTSAMNIVEFPKGDNLIDAFSKIFENSPCDILQSSSKVSLLEAIYFKLQSEWSHLKSFNDPYSVYAIMPYQIRFL